LEKNIQKLLNNEEKKRKKIERVRNWIRFSRL
jgi:hypothetical protein